MSSPRDLPSAADLKLLSQHLMRADDGKLLRVTEMLDQTAPSSASNALLDPLRPRLGLLKPARPLRFARLLLIPFDTVLVPARAWRPGDPSLSRAVIGVLSETVRAGMGDVAAEVDRLIAGRRTSDTGTIDLAGGRLWPAAAEVLARAPAPLGWDGTGLPITVWPAIAQAASVVLGRAVPLRRLMEDVKLGAVSPEDAALRAVLRELPETPPEGAAMVVRMMLEQLPRSASVLRGMITMSDDPVERRVLQRSLDRGMEQMLTHLEDESGVARGLGQSSVASAGVEVRRLARLLEDLDADPGASRQKPRLKQIRDRLDGACQARFADGVDRDLVQPLSVPDRPVTSQQQVVLEGRARDLRVFETAARGIGGSARYDALLGDAARAVEAAGTAGTLSPGRMARLVEILQGSEAAEEVYSRHRTAGSVVRAGA